MLHRTQSLAARFVPALALASLSLTASAYDFVTIDPPGGVFTTLSGLNGSGTAVGSTTFADDSSVSFRYEVRTGTSTPLPAGPGGLAFVALGINDSGTIVGALGDADSSQGAILDKKGRFTTFTIPGFASTTPRAVGPSGLVSGYAIAGPGDWSGFLYDPKNGSVELFLTGSSQVIPQGINARGQLVGSVNLPADGAYPGSPPGQYGFVRERDGTITLFRVNGLSTRARGISDHGRITGFVAAPQPVGYTASAPTGGGYRDLAVLVDSLFVVPDSEVPESVQTFPQAIDNQGRIVGTWSDYGLVNRGFVATPTNKGKK